MSFPQKARNFITQRRKYVGVANQQEGPQETHHPQPQTAKTTGRILKSPVKQHRVRRLEAAVRKILH